VKGQTSAWEVLNSRLDTIASSLCCIRKDSRLSGSLECLGRKKAVFSLLLRGRGEVEGTEIPPIPGEEVIVFTVGLCSTLSSYLFWTSDFLPIKHTCPKLYLAPNPHRTGEVQCRSYFIMSVHTQDRVGPMQSPEQGLEGPLDTVNTLQLKLYYSYQ
jgi:hypothetical protein